MDLKQAPFQGLRKPKLSEEMVPEKKTGRRPPGDQSGGAGGHPVRGRRGAGREHSGQAAGLLDPWQGTGVKTGARRRTGLVGQKGLRSHQALCPRPAGDVPKAPGGLSGRGGGPASS